MSEESLWEFPGKSMFANDHMTGETAHGERILFKNINEISSENFISLIKLRFGSIVHKHATQLFNKPEVSGIW